MSRQALQARKLLQNTAPPLIRGSSARGVLHWHFWDGRPWDIENTEYYHKQGLVHDVEEYRAELAKAQRRLQMHGPRMLDEFYVKHYTSLIRENKKLLPLFRFTSTENFLLFLIRTAPAHIFKPVKNTLESLIFSNFAILEDIKALNTIGKRISLLPHHPLLFKMKVAHWKDSAARREAIEIKRLQAKRDRLLWKEDELDCVLAKGPYYQVRSSRTREAEAHRLKASRSLPAHSSKKWDLDPRMWAIRGFGAAVHMRLSHFRNVNSILMQVTKFMSPSSTPLVARNYRKAWFARFFNLCTRVESTIMKIWKLAEDVAFLRAFRIHTFPDSDLKRETYLARAIFRVVDRSSSKDVNRRASRRATLKTSKRENLGDQTVSRRGRD